jgi:hypothetical protein
MSKKYFFLLVFLLVSVFASAQYYDEELEKIRDPDKCYAKCLIPINVPDSTFTVFEYLDEEEIEGVKKQTIKLEPATTKWVKTNNDIDCTSPNPDDCEVFYLEKIPAVTREIYVVTDTSKVKDFKISTIKIKKEISDVPEAKWREILCDSKNSKYVIQQIVTYLSKNGSKIDKNTVKLNSELRRELATFQKANNLPIGQLNIETLNHMKIKY